MRSIISFSEEFKEVLIFDKPEDCIVGIQAHNFYRAHLPPIEFDPNEKGAAERAGDTKEARDATCEQLRDDMHVGIGRLLRGYDPMTFMGSDVTTINAMFDLLSQQNSDTLTPRGEQHYLPYARAAGLILRSIDILEVNQSVNSDELRSV